MNNKILLMRFKKEDNKAFSISLRAPRANVTEEEIKKVMDYIVDNSLMIPGGVAIVGTIDAKITSTTTETIDLILE